MKKAVAMLLAICMAVGLAGCGGGSEPGAGGGEGTTYGKVGVTVWIYKGEVLPTKANKEGGAKLLC